MVGLIIFLFFMSVPLSLLYQHKKFESVKVRGLINMNIQIHSMQFLHSKMYISLSPLWNFLKILVGALGNLLHNFIVAFKNPFYDV